MYALSLGDGGGSGRMPSASMKAGELISLMRAMMSGMGVTNPSSFPSRLFLRFCQGRKLIVVSASDIGAGSSTCPTLSRAML